MIADLMTPATDEYEPTASDYQSYDAYQTTVNLVERLKQAKEHLMPGEWVELMGDLGRLSSQELLDATRRQRPYKPMPPMWKGDDGSPPNW